MDQTADCKHLISIRSTNLLKLFAILVVMTGHYYRYADISSPLSFLGHFGYFGAALFAFLSGYGVCISYQKKGIVPGIIGNLLQKFKKCYLPFLIVSFISVLLIYGFRWDLKLPIRILFGTDDGAMWYIPYIFGFYLLFAVIYAQKSHMTVKNMILTVCIFGQVVFCMIMNVDSQWYTASGALLVGVLVAQIDSWQNQKNIRILIMIGSGLLLIMGGVLTEIFDDMVALSKFFTLVSGIGFSCLLFYAQSFLDVFIVRHERKLSILLQLGSDSLWMYCIHMKVMKLFYEHPSHMVVPYLLTSIAVSALSAFIYTKIAEKIIRR